MTGKDRALCGLPGDLQHPDDVINFTTAKVGGQPVFPGDSPPSNISEEFTICLKCGRKLALIAQVQ